MLSLDLVWHKSVDAFRICSINILFIHLLQLSSLNIQVNTNGIISFFTDGYGYTPQSFPLNYGETIIAPYWADVNLWDGGNISYREEIRQTQNQDPFEEVDSIIRDAFSNMQQFTSSWMFIATWDQVPFYGSYNSFIVRWHLSSCI